MSVIKKADGWIVNNSTGLHRFETEEEAIAFDKTGVKPEEDRATWYGEANGSEEKEDSEEEAGSDE